MIRIEVKYKDSFSVVQNKSHGENNPFIGSDKGRVRESKGELLLKHITI